MDNLKREDFERMATLALMEVEREKELQTLKSKLEVKSQVVELPYGNQTLFEPLEGDEEWRIET